MRKGADADRTPCSFFAARGAGTLDKAVHRHLIAALPLKSPRPSPSLFHPNTTFGANTTAPDFGRSTCVGVAGAVEGASYG